MKTYAKQISLFTEANAILSPGDFRNLANHTPLPESEKAKKMNAICGPKCLEQLKKFSRVGLWAKTFTGLLIGQTGWFSTKCKLTWRLRGTKFSRMYCQLAPSTLPIEGTGYGLLPTPSAMEDRSSPEAWDARQDRMIEKGHGSFTMPINQMAKRGLLPTPTAMDSTQATANMKSTQVKDGSMHSITLSRALTMGMLPTPTTSTGGAEPAGKTGRKLITVVTGLLPTPTANDNPAKNTGKRNQDGLQKRAFQQTGKTSQLNPLFVLEMMGFPPTHTLEPFKTKIQWIEV